MRSGTSPVASLDPTSLYCDYPAGFIQETLCSIPCICSLQVLFGETSVQEWAEIRSLAPVGKSVGVKERRVSMPAGGPSAFREVIFGSYLFSPSRGSTTYEIPSSWVHSDRASGRDRHHRGLDRATSAGRSISPRGRPSCPVHQQPQADRAGHAQLPRPAGHLTSRLQRVLLGDMAAVRSCLTSSKDHYNAWNCSGTTAPDQRPPDRMFRYGGAANTHGHARPVNTYYCPTDPNNLNLARSGWHVTSQNYVVNFGNMIVTSPSTTSRTA